MDKQDIDFMHKELPKQFSKDEMHLRTQYTVDGKSVSEDVHNIITKNAANSENRMRQEHFFPSARLAWKACLHGLSPRRILLPSYIGYTEREGSGVLDPVTEQDLVCSFYPVGQDLLAPADVIANCLAREPDIGVVLLIHYFGWPGGDVSAIRSVCDQVGVVLVEDCAHAFHWGQAEPNLGVIGDYAFFSIHKYLASGTGGLLRANNRHYPEAMLPREESIEHSVLTLLARAELGAIAEKRRENLAQALEGIKAVEGLRPIRKDIPQTPQSLPCWVEGEGIREKLYFRLMDRKVPTTALYYQMHNLLKREKFPESFEVSDHIINFPIHQDMTAENISMMIRETVIAMEQLRS
jgi:hypothetical protein